MNRYVIPIVLLITLSNPSSLLAEDTLQQIEAVGIRRTEEGQAAQAKIDAIAAHKRDLVDEYRNQLKLVENLESYTALLERQLNSQAEEITTLSTSIAEVAVIERQILPLMERMIEGLGAFIELDVPFLMDERRQRVETLRDLLARSDVTVAEKTRRVFEAYQVETDYGRTVEAYTAKLDREGSSTDAEFLRVGRVNLLYRTLGSDEIGYWDGVNRRWETLEPTPWRRLIDQGLQVARQEVAPELLWIALNPKDVETL